MKFELKQQFRIESARRLPQLPQGHPCAELHGHSFQITLIFHGDLDSKVGWMMDYNQIKSTMAPLIQQIDHKYLNEVEGLSNPTSEHLAYWLFNRGKSLIPELVQVRISETPDSECAYPIL